MGVNPIRVTVWNEYLHERTQADVQAIYPDGIHEALAAPLRAEGLAVRTATLDEPEHGLTEDVLAEHRRAALVGPPAPPRGGRRGRRPGPGAGAGRHGPDRPALRPLLEDLQAPDGHDLQPEAGARPASASGSGSSHRGHPIAEGLPRTLRARSQEEMYGEPFDIPAPDELVFVSWFQGGEVFRSGCCYTRGARPDLLLPPRPRDLPDLPRRQRPARHRQRGALGRPTGCRPVPVRPQRAAGSAVSAGLTVTRSTSGWRCLRRRRVGADGLFLDQRNQRVVLRRRMPGRRG